MTIEQAVKVANLLQELEAIDALRAEIDMFLSRFEYIPTELADKIINLTDEAYINKEKEIEAM